MEYISPIPYYLKQHVEWESDIGFHERINWFKWCLWEKPEERDKIAGDWWDSIMATTDGKDVGDASIAEIWNASVPVTRLKKRHFIIKLPHFGVCVTRHMAAKFDILGNSGKVGRIIKTEGNEKFRQQFNAVLRQKMDEIISSEIEKYELKEQDNE